MVTHKCSWGTVSNGYCRFQVTLEDGTIKTIAKHRALAEHFLTNDDPERKTVVHHIDGNPYNNELSNLEWVSQQENVQKQVNLPRPSIFDYPIMDEELTNEIWVEFLPNWMVSNLGRRKNLTTGKISLGSINKNTGYVRWNFGHDAQGKAIEYQAHRAVYQAFHPDEKIIVINHKDGCRNNNRLDNLENVTQSQNVMASLQWHKARLIGQLDDEGNILQVFPTASEAERQLSDPSTHQAIGQIASAIRNHKKAFGYYWRYITQEQGQKFIESIK